MDFQTIITLMGIGISALALIVTIGSPVIAWAFKSLHKRIDDLKLETDEKILALKQDAELKRIETRDTMLELVEAKFEAIWNALKDIKDEVKRHYEK